MYELLSSFECVDRSATEQGTQEYLPMVLLYFNSLSNKSLLSDATFFRMRSAAFTTLSAASPLFSKVLKLMAVAEKISGVAVLRSIAVFSWDSKPFKYFL